MKKQETLKKILVDCFTDMDFSKSTTKLKIVMCSQRYGERGCYRVNGEDYSKASSRSIEKTVGEW